MRAAARRACAAERTSPWATARAAAAPWLSSTTLRRWRRTAFVCASANPDAALAAQVDRREPISSRPASTSAASLSSCPEQSETSAPASTLFFFRAWRRASIDAGAGGIAASTDPRCIDSSARRNRSAGTSSACSTSVVFNTLTRSSSVRRPCSRSVAARSASQCSKPSVMPITVRHTCKERLAVL